MAEVSAYLTQGFLDLLAERNRLRRVLDDACDEIDRLRGALKIAVALLAENGYADDPDSREEWQIITSAAAGPKEEP